MPDNAPPEAPDNASKTSTDPCVFARIDGCAASIMRAVPLIKPKFQPTPSSTNAKISRTIESAGAKAASIPEARSVAPEATAIAVRPTLSTSWPVRSEGKYIAPI